MQTEETQASDLAITGELAKILRRQYEQMRAQVSKRARKQRKRKSGFKVGFALFPMTWRRRLREAKASGAAYDLAITILAELHKLDHNAVKEIILSGEVTGLPEQTRRRAIKDLVQINLIKVERKEGQAYRATQLHYIKRTSRE